jgi:hypothetical protein
MGDEAITTFLSVCKAAGKSAPAGRHWQAFFDLLRRQAESTGAARPPVPLILAASGASDDSKRRRLAEQLRWAHYHGVLAEAMQFLESLDSEGWTHGSAEGWHRSSYY